VDWGVVELELIGVRVEVPANAPMVLLRERSGAERILPIFIGPAEAQAIALALDGIETPRPMTHDLLGELLSELGAKIEWVIITEIKDKTFFAQLYMRRADDEQIVVNSRSSDAIALAVRVGCKIYADEGVVDEAGFVESAGQPGEERPEEVVEEFKEFLENLSPEDFSD